MNLPALTLHEAGELLRTRQISSRELTQAVLERIHRVDAHLQSYVTVNEETALKQADQADELLNKNARSPVLGIPLAVKDNFLMQNVRTTCASKILKNFIGPFDATVVKKLRGAGVVFIGKTNLDEFAMGSSTENSAFF